MFGVKILKYRRINGVKVTIVRGGLFKRAWKIATEGNGEIRIREDIFNAYEKSRKNGLTEAEMNSILLHEAYHQKSFWARPHIWNIVERFPMILSVVWIVAVMMLALLLWPIQIGTRLGEGIVVFVFLTVLLFLGLKLYTWTIREQESAADAYEAMKTGRPKITKAYKENLFKKKIISEKKQYTDEHGTLKERKAWIDSIMQK